MKRISVEVVYALPEQQKLVQLEMDEGSTIVSAIEQSGVLKAYPEIDLHVNKVGIFGKLVAKPEQQTLKWGDRVEIYRPLLTRKKV